MLGVHFLRQMNTGAHCSLIFLLQLNSIFHDSFPLTMHRAVELLTFNLNHYTFDFVYGDYCVVSKLMLRCAQMHSRRTSTTVRQTVTPTCSLCLMKANLTSTRPTVTGVAVDWSLTRRMISSGYVGVLFTVIHSDNSCLQNAEFWAKPWNLPVSVEFPRFHGILQNSVLAGDKYGIFWSDSGPSGAINN